MSQTTTKERIIAALVAAFMLLSTVGMYVAMVLGNKNPQPNYPASERQKAESNKKLQEYMEKLEKRSAAARKLMSDKHYPEFSKYKKANVKFDSKKVTKLVIKDLKKGDGEEIKQFADGQYYYIGWLSNGKVFDSSFDGDKLKDAFSSESVIKGWEQGVKGMKKGGIRELTIPAKLAYGDKANGDIPANSVLKFIVMAAYDLTEEEIKSLPKAEF